MFLGILRVPKHALQTIVRTAGAPGKKLILTGEKKTRELKQTRTLESSFVELVWMWLLVLQFAVVHHVRDFKESIDFWTLGPWSLGKL